MSGAVAEAGFALDPRLAAATRPWADWPLCHVRLMDDRRFPWLVLVPRRADAVELYALDDADRALLLDEIVRASRLLARAYPEAKINVAALGNQVPQLHVHVVARLRQDAAWPGVVWAAGPAERYDDEGAGALLARLASADAAGASLIRN